MKNFLNSVKVATLGSSVFDLTHDVKMSAKMGLLYPTLCMEAVPGDKFKLGCEALIRFLPLVSPVMHRYDVTMHYYFVPWRLLWSNFEKYIAPEEWDSVAPAFPTVSIDVATYNAFPLIDYLGLPSPGANTLTVSAGPFAAYQKIYNEYYRDQNLIAKVDDVLQDGLQPGIAELITLRRRAWEHDYFTAALPFAQKGNPVEIPMQADVVVKSSALPGTAKFLRSDGTPYPGVALSGVSQQEGTGALVTTGSGGNTSGFIDPNGTLEVQNANTQITDLRRAVKLQAFLEKLARGGSLYTEVIKSMFGVKSSDARLQRPEYITGVKSPIVISEVLNTTGTVDAPQGNMAGHAVGVTSGKYGSYFCEEHGYIMGIMSVLPRTAYQQGVPKHFKKINDRYDFFWKDFENIGEQEITNEEVYAPHTTPGSTFGYIPRYGEYKFMQSRVAGQMKTTLDTWQHGRIFTSDPALNQAFVECTPDKRVFAVTDPAEDEIVCHVLHTIYARRKMSKYSTPSF